MFDDKIVEEIKYYVYALKDPRSGEIFYIGKGKGNRIFQHIKDALETNDASDKLDTIRDILNGGETVEYFLIRHGLSEEIAFEVEATLIDLLNNDRNNKFNITNIVQGSHTYDRGVISINEAMALYGGRKIDIIDPVMLININKLFKRNMSKDELYEATRQSWKVGEDRNKIKYVLVHYKGIVREVYEVKEWYVVVNGIGQKRWAFNGYVANSDIRNRYLYGLVKKYFFKGAANPIRYINM